MNKIADPSAAREFLASMPLEQINRMFEINWESGVKSGKEEYQKETVCRLLASGMSAGEIATILCVKMELIIDIASHNNEQVAAYTKQLKGRRYRIKRQQNKPDRHFTVQQDIVDKCAAEQ